MIVCRAADARESPAIACTAGGWLLRKPTVYKAGDFKQITFKEGELMVHDAENIGDTELLFTTVEFLDSPNAPLEPHSRTRSAVEV
jgi:hypothetical protein